MSELYELPDGWEWIEFKKVFNNPTSKPFQIKKSEYMEKGKYPIIDQGKNFIIGYTNNEKKVYYNSTNCIIFGDHTRQIKYIDFDFVIGADGTKILKEKNPNLYDLKFLYYYLLSKEIKSLGYSRHFKLVKQMYFAVPPLQEQKRIVAKLDALFERINKAIALHQQNINQADAFMGSVLNEVFEELEGRYGVMNFSEIIGNKIQNGLYKHKDFYNDDGVQILRIDNFYDGRVNDFGIKKLSLTNEELNKYSLQENDIVINRVNSMEYLGKCAFIPKLDEAMVFESNMMRISVIKDNDPLYIVYMLQTENIKKQISKKAKRAVNQCSINQTDVNTLNIPIPPLKTQQKTVAYLDQISGKIEQIKTLQSKKLQSLKELKASLLDKAFRGEL